MSLALFRLDRSTYSSVSVCQDVSDSLEILNESMGFAFCLGVSRKSIQGAGGRGPKLTRKPIEP